MLQPLFVADWLDVIFVHFCVDADRLQRRIPLGLDRFRDGGDAYVSLVAFTQHDLRPPFGGRLARLLAAPLARHELLNVRTYVRNGRTRGIFFMTEWISNRFAALIGPRTYGLPYRLGRLRYDGMRRVVTAGEGRLDLRAKRRDVGLKPAAPGTLDHFLLERYTAFTHRNGITRRFDVDHVPWPQARIDVTLPDVSLLPLSGDWLAGAELVAAHDSPGVHDVAIGRPRRVEQLDQLDQPAGAGCAASATSDQ